MGFIIGLLTTILVLDCIALTFLILIQLPKKEAGLGLAFGGSAADALFGAGSGTVLTKATKYAATLFFGLAVVLGVMQSNYHRKSRTEFQQEVEKQTQAGGGMPVPRAATPPAAQETPAPTAPATATPTPSAPAAQPPPQTAPVTPAPSQPAPANPAPASPAPPK